MSRRGNRKEEQENVDSLRALREGEKVEVEESQLRSAARRDRVDKGKEEAAAAGEGNGAGLALAQVGG